MPEPVNVEPTAKVIDEMATMLEEKARELRQIANAMRADKDLNNAAEAATLLRSLMGNLRFDLLVMRALRGQGQD
jgi:hypothetical protein